MEVQEKVQVLRKSWKLKRTRQSGCVNLELASQREAQQIEASSMARKQDEIDLADSILMPVFSGDPDPESALPPVPYEDAKKEKPAVTRTGKSALDFSRLFKLEVDASTALQSPLRRNWSRATRWTQSGFYLLSFALTSPIQSAKPPGAGSFEKDSSCPSPGRLLWEFKLEDYDADVRPLLKLAWEVNTSMKTRDVEFEVRWLLISSEAAPPQFQHPKIISQAQTYARSLTEQQQEAHGPKLLGPQVVVMEVVPKVLQGFWLPPPTTSFNMPSQQLCTMALGVTKAVEDQGPHL
ncbi:hypothetical protein L3Q82_000296 [Scortum barcoo]|uniref:Uncharacterized protein n=1 Tax=Scortum barcoo TaxID=214431 RepID=A0ACB8XAC8_9TELE|nr:hypothetical protein L3Q82_000296 [Scortum barcoo]